MEALDAFSLRVSNKEFSCGCFAMSAPADTVFVEDSPESCMGIAVQLFFYLFKVTVTPFQMLRRGSARSSNNDVREVCVVG